MGKYFIGVEVEGKFKGALTLFVEGSSDNTLEYIEERNLNIQHIYFGARYKTFSAEPSTVSYKDTLICVSCPHKRYAVTLEFANCIEYSERLFFIEEFVGYGGNVVIVVNGIFEMHKFINKVSKLVNVSFKLFYQDEGVVIIPGYSISKFMFTPKETYQYLNDTLLENKK